MKMKNTLHFHFGFMFCFLFTINKSVKIHLDFKSLLHSPGTGLVVHSYNIGKDEEMIPTLLTIKNS